MNTRSEIIEWFKNEPVPGTFRNPAIILGGACLLKEFIDCIERSESKGDLSIVVPFISSEFFEKNDTWHNLHHKVIKLKIITRTLTSARIIRNKLGVYPWQSFDVRVLSSLHAKIYVFMHPNGGGVCLIGSHNFSVSAIKHNDEAGMLFLSNINDEVNTIIHAWHEQVEQLARQAVDISHETYFNSNINLN